MHTVNAHISMPHIIRVSLWLAQCTNPCSASVGRGREWRERPHFFVARAALDTLFNAHCGCRVSVAALPSGGRSRLNNPYGKARIPEE